VDNNLARLGEPKVNIVLKNGGAFNNVGQFWFGTDGENTPDTRIHMTINNGTLNLTGGDTAPVENGDLIVNADLAFFYDYQESLPGPSPPARPGRPKAEEYSINFTGSGSITVDSSGIWVYSQDEFGIWNEGTAGPKTYEDLWNMGILKAHGLSGKTGTIYGDGNSPITLTPATFSTYFSTSGTPGSDDYTLTSNVPQLQTVKWVGSASGDWNEANGWKNVDTNTTGNAATVLGARNGNEGMNNINVASAAARNIVIDGGNTVEYYYPTGNGAGTGSSDFRLRQGTNLTITGGATFLQDQSDYPNNSGNGWMRMDPSNLILDNGTFRRVGEPPEQIDDGIVGGGPMIFGSFNVDNNLARLGALPPQINIELKNGGRIENVGQFWFGTDGENTPDTRIRMTINEGTIDLTGGDTAPVENGDLIVNADLAFFYDYQESLPGPSPPARPGRPKDEEYEINFTGPGSITVDNSGIWVYRQDEFGIWNEGTAGPLEYEDLWDMGILKANGLSGRTGTLYGDSNNPTTLTPALFSEYFSVTGTPGSDDYILNSLIAASPDLEQDADYNADGTIDAADHVAGRKLGLDLNLWQQQFGQASPGAGGGGSGGVPEPGTMLLVLLGLASVSLSKRSSR
jgi:hypothetical protein